MRLETAFGAFLDPVADKITMSAVREWAASQNSLALEYWLQHGRAECFSFWHRPALCFSWPFRMVTSRVHEEDMDKYHSIGCRRSKLVIAVDTYRSSCRTGSVQARSAPLGNHKVGCRPKEHATAEPLRMKRHSRRHILFFVRSIVVVSFFPSPPPERCRLRFSSGTSSQILLAIPHRTALWLHRWFRGDPTSTSSAGPPPIIQFYFVHRPKPSTSFRLPKLPPHPHKTLRFLDWDFVPFNDDL
ncbi:hypothetical protein GW17_00031978 [Ensete ventricosum]|nr:hypothetical protein GW17_00031978 [Ensete ventricosum]